ncbi:MAG: ERF family protein [Desulfovibrio sp.]|nr:ERF family protein [Desulfovibrio sp.]
MCNVGSFQSPDIGEIAKALAEAQGELPAAVKNAQNPHLKNKYADIKAVYDAIRDVLPKHGLAVVQTMLPTDGTKAHVRTTLAHSSGQWFAGECVMPLDRQGGAQGMGSAITYARRYSLAAIVGVVSDEDDDGNAAQGRTARAQAQQQRAVAKAANQNPASDPQRKKFFVIMRQRHGDDRNAMLQELSQFFGREIQTSNELTKDDMAAFIDAVETPPIQEEEAY